MGEQILKLKKLLERLDPKTVVVIRWLLVPVCGVIGFYAAFLVALLAYELLSRWCPGGEIVSGACSVGWTNLLPLYLGAGLAPVFCGVLAIRVSPSRSLRAVWSIYGAGVLVAAVMFGPSEPKLALFSIIVGACVAAALPRKPLS